MATRTTFNEVIDEFRTAGSMAERGTKFEELMVDYFRLDPTLSVVYDNVCMWSEWDHNESTHDSGIDLVARNVHTGGWTAIQCKFYDPKHALQKQDIDTFFTASGRSWDGITFDNRIIISTTDRWSHHAEAALTNQTVPVQRIGTPELAEAPINWMQAAPGSLDFTAQRAVRYGLQAHQKEAIARIQEGFESHDRGKWISACGTGKTFTSLKLAEQRCADNGGHLKVLFLAPSISLVSQTLREWMAQTKTEIRPFVVCSDTKASKQAEDITVHDIPVPTTNAQQLADSMRSVGRRGKQMTVVFSTYQSIDVVAKAQQMSDEAFDLILCDEAHRTTGVTLSGDASESAFVKVHDNTLLPASKRLYMTATPRIYGEDAKRKAAESSAVLTSMDDEDTYGPEFHRLSFGEAVERDLLTDYKVMILCVTNDAIAGPLQSTLAEDHELNLNDAAKIVGCWNGLAKRTTDLDFGKDPIPMKRAVAFAANIKASKAFAESFPSVVESLADDLDAPNLEVAAKHVDGTMNALQRAESLAWLKAPVQDGECRVLSNARCLSEGVDVPALDAVLFLSPRNSLVDVVQSVGRVMRRAKDKDYGYIILPVAIDANESPSEAMKDNKRFKVVWDVLNALRAHDDRFNAMINSIELDGSTKGKISVGVFGKRDATDADAAGRTRESLPVQMPLFTTEMRDAILARIVTKVGERDYWDSWTNDVVTIHQNQIARIRAILRAADESLRASLRARFDAFHSGLQATINESISMDDAIDMLSQHLITRPVFEALFPTGGFASHNPVSITMQQMVEALADQGLESETAALADFYSSVCRRAESVTTPAGRQTIIHRLYEDFFKNAFPKQASSLGVVYTPVEIVDFILRSADDVCRSEFGYGLTDEGVHILDPFTGTGTFIVRLLESGIIKPEDLARKYASELWANEIMLLAYYIACVNIETTYQAIRLRNLGEDAEPEDLPYEQFPGATLTDTFQITEESDRADTSLIPVNNERIEAQLAAPIRVIVGNPPYSAGQSSANDNNANIAYPTLDARIADTYAKRSTGTNKNSLYDSYVRAFRWASDRIGNQGVVAFVSNNGWVDGNAADGIRKSFIDEFSQIWVYNLRGNQRTAGETSRREGGKVFGSGARTGVAVLVAVKRPDTDTPCTLFYYGVPDYQTREEKLAALEHHSLTTTPWQTITPNQAGDWINQRNPRFVEFAPIALKDKAERVAGIFSLATNGLKTNRDAWCYNFARAQVASNMQRMIDAYNEEADKAGRAGAVLDQDSTRVSWSHGLVADAQRGRQHEYKPKRIYAATYRPFCHQWAYFDRPLNDRVYRLPDIFPTPHHQNLGILVTAPGGNAPFTALMCDAVPDLVSVTGAGNAAQFYPRWTYEKVADEDVLFGGETEVDEWGYRRVDNITDAILEVYRDRFGPHLTKDDIFYYVYGVLHSEQYRTTFAADLKRMLPRIPLAASPADFEAFVESGRKLADLHVNYESVDPYPLHEQTTLETNEWELYRVQKMKWLDKTTKNAIVYNNHITLSDIPALANEYMLGSRSALEWLIDRYQIRTDKASGIVNDPNDWCREHDDPRYIVDLVKRVTRVSVETMQIVRSLPELPLG